MRGFVPALVPRESKEMGKRLAVSCRLVLRRWVPDWM
jgi:hypothetical protein